MKKILQSILTLLISITITNLTMNIAYAQGLYTCDSTCTKFGDKCTCKSDTRTGTCGRVDKKLVCIITNPPPKPAN